MTTDLTLTLRLPVRVNDPVALGERIASILTQHGPDTLGTVTYIGPAYAIETPPPPRVIIRKAAYRGKDGFTVADGRSRIFTTSRTSAERIKARLLNHEDVRQADFEA